MVNVRDKVHETLFLALESPSNEQIARLDAISIYVAGNEDQFSKTFHEILHDSRINFLKINSTNQQIYLNRLVSAIEAETFKSQNFPEKLESSDLLPKFSLSNSDRDRMLELCAQIRKIILASDAFDHPHRVRLSDRVAAVEAEIYKDKGLFDVVLGMVSDVGETLGKFGKDIKPLTERVNEILKIARANSEEYKQLPSPEEVAKGLPAPEESEVTSDEG